MPHDITLITTITVGFVLAFALGMVANRLRLPPLVGYLVAGVALGPFTPGYVADAQLAAQLAEIGVILLMFGVGLHFSLADLLAVRRIAIPGAVAQIGIATAMGIALAMGWGWSFGAGFVLGLSLSVASTVVLLKALEERNSVETPEGRIAIGWLIVEDLAMVLALVLLPAIAGALGGTVETGGHGGPEHGLVATLAITLAKVTAFVATALLIGPRVMPWLLRSVARTGSRELFTLSVLALSLGIALGAAKLFGVSFALGAFFAGMVLNESDLSHKAAANSMPLQDAFAVLFFVSVGMLFDPNVIVDHPVMVAAVVALIIFGKSLVALGVVLALRFPLRTALTVSASLAQIGEFSFILAGLGVTYKLLPPHGLSLVLAGALISITLNPLVFAGSDAICRWLRARPRVKARVSGLGEKNFALLQEELAAAREKAAAKAAAHGTFTPQELAEKFPLFEGLTPEQREVLILHFRPQDAQPGERLIRVGDPGDAVYFISAGAVEVEVGKRRIKLGPGDFFGEMALITGQRRSADVTAVDYTKLLTLSQGDFRECLRRYPDMKNRISLLANEREEMNRKSADEQALEPA
jgi:CPA2 family monovalent cation:H+ antiporter-2